MTEEVTPLPILIHQGPFLTPVLAVEIGDIVYWSASQLYFYIWRIWRLHHVASFCSEFFALFRIISHQYVRLVHSDIISHW